MNKHQTKLPASEPDTSDAIEHQRELPLSLRMARDLALACVGITGVLGDEAHGLYRRCVDRGRENVRRREERLKTPRLTSRGNRLSNPDKAARRRELHSRLAYEDWRAALTATPGAWFNVPTAADVNKLSEQVAVLEAKIEQLSAGSPEDE